VRESFPGRAVFPSQVRMRYSCVTLESLRYNFCRTEIYSQFQEISPMDESDIYARLTDIFEDVFDEDSIKVIPSLSAKDVDGWDSLTHIRLLLTVEKAFKVKFSTSEIGKLETVGDLVTLIKART
jgi:acyl carrier protein